MIRIELTEAERDFLVKVVEAGLDAMGIPSLMSKLRSLQPPADAAIPATIPQAAP